MEIAFEGRPRQGALHFPNSFRPTIVIRILSWRLGSLAASRIDNGRLKCVIDSPFVNTHVLFFCVNGSCDIGYIVGILKLEIQSICSCVATRWVSFQTTLLLDGKSLIWGGVISVRSLRFTSCIESASNSKITGRNYSVHFSFVDGNVYYSINSNFLEIWIVLYTLLFDIILVKLNIS